MGITNKVEFIKKLGYGILTCCFIYFAYTSLMETQKPAVQTNKENCLRQKNTVFNGKVVEVRLDHY